MKHEVKIIEGRDIGTCLVLMAIMMMPDNEHEKWLLAKVGYSGGATHLVHLTLLSSNESHYSPDAWGSITLKEIHEEIVANWEVLRSGDMIDIAFIKGRRMTMCMRDKEEYARMMSKYQQEESE